MIPKSQPPDAAKFKNRKSLEDGSGFELASGEIYFYTSVGGWWICFFFLNLLKY
jgi:hypothetical protein